MSNKREIPGRLYKYRSFSNLTLEALIGDKHFFADPSCFNDPLDTKPVLATDLDAMALAEILRRLVEERVHAEMTAAAEMIKSRGPKTINHIEDLSRRRAEQMIAEVRYNATNPDYEIEDPEQLLLRQYIENELLRRYDKGIVCLAERSDCPLMWSHYGDQHKGVCIGYSVPERATENLYKVSYGGSRLIEARTVAAMVRGDETARRKVDEAVFTRKAEAWGYECEWRLIGPQGAQHSPLELEEVVFGMRCSDAIKYAVVKALEDRRRGIEFYEMRERRGEFVLEKDVLDTGEITASLPRRAIDIWDEFGPIIDDASGKREGCLPLRSGVPDTECSRLLPGHPNRSPIRTS